MNYVTFWLANVISIVSSSPYFLTVKKKKKRNSKQKFRKGQELLTILHSYKHVINLLDWTFCRTVIKNVYKYISCYELRQKTIFPFFKQLIIVINVFPLL